MKQLPNHVLAQVVKDAGESKPERAKRLVQFFEHGIADKKISLENVSLMGIASALGCIDPYDIQGSVRKLGRGATDRDSKDFVAESLYSESAALMSNAFQTVTQSLIQDQLISGYNSFTGVSDRLVTTQRASMRNTKVAGFTHVGTSFEVPEGHPYPTVRFGEKYVTTKETKYGAMIELTEELIMFDQTGDIARHARMIGEGLAAEKEYLILRGIVDEDSGAGTYVYRPSGVGEALYAAGNLNLKTSNALVDWTDIDAVLSYRAVTVVDDRIDGTTRPVLGLNNASNKLLVPEALRSTGWYIKNATGTEQNTNNSAGTANRQTNAGNPVAGFIGEVLSSPILDGLTNGTSNWFYGDFAKQFVWTELMPLQTFTQGADSNAAFETDTVLRFKARHFGGLSALDSIYVTKCSA